MPDTNVPRPTSFGPGLRWIIGILLAVMLLWVLLLLGNPRPA